MYYLFRKEISGFFSSLIGYIVIILFITITGLFLWVFKGPMNILEGGYATLDSLFIIAPWVFLMLIPTITMRMFSEEKRTGTLDLLLTRPLSETQIVLAKFTAALVLVILSLLPTLMYYFSVVLLGNPTGNLDTGGTWGSYIGLFFLAGSYAIIGLYCSSLTDNVIISFLLTVALCMLICFGFDQIGNLSMFNAAGALLMKLGIVEHYRSMSRGVIDSRDIVYFLALGIIFFLLTRYNLERRKW
ncbi:MAG: gliding motility-associated ABC transporter permease subunit GldF [Bacteroidales bacterium]|nr:gliding motility-associated ABC transporter permease subunit GldF [Bacteroidales bacterium]